jgi:dTDP-4-dehydrorhamnose reductase
VVSAPDLSTLKEGQEQPLIDEALQLAQACDEYGFPLIHISSSLVFAGLDEGPFTEKDTVVPASFEGVVLSRVEELVRGATTAHIILRTSQLFSSVGANPLTQLLQRFEAGGSIKLPDTVFSPPTYVDDFARVITAMIDQLSCGAQLWGTYHYCSSDSVSQFQFAEAVLAVASQYLDVSANHLALAVGTQEDDGWDFPELKCEKILYTLGVKQFPWRVFINAAVKQYFDQD